MFSPLEQFDMIIYFSCKHPHPNLPLFNLLIPFILSTILLIIYFVLSLKLKQFRLIFTSSQMVWVNFLYFIFNLLKQQTGKLGYKYVPFLSVLFYSILIMNLFSLLPFGYLSQVILV
jgi:F0F1-type ATP synthase membrane subunit a